MPHKTTIQKQPLDKGPKGDMHVLPLKAHSLTIIAETKRVIQYTRFPMQEFPILTYSVILNGAIGVYLFHSVVIQT
jgi:hypothetical protein